MIQGKVWTGRFWRGIGCCVDERIYHMPLAPACCCQGPLDLFCTAWVHLAMVGGGATNVPTCGSPITCLLDRRTASHLREERCLFLPCPKLAYPVGSSPEAVTYPQMTQECEGSRGFILLTPPAQFCLRFFLDVLSPYFTVDSQKAIDKLTLLQAEMISPLDFDRMMH